MRKFLCKSDIIIMGHKMIKSGDIISVGDSVKSEDGSLSIIMDINKLMDKNSFEEISNIELDIVESSEDEELIIKDWILQLKLKTSRKKLRVIEDFLRDNIDNMT